MKFIIRSNQYFSLLLYCAHQHVHKTSPIHLRMLSILYNTNIAPFWWWNPSENLFSAMRMIFSISLEYFFCSDSNRNFLFGKNFGTCLSQQRERLCPGLGVKLVSLSALCKVEKSFTKSAHNLSQFVFNNAR